MVRDSSIGTIILYGGGLLILYYILKSWGIISTPCDPAVCTAQCPRGPKYSRGYFGSCDPGYVMCGTLDEDCCCLYATSSTNNNNINNWKPLSDKQIQEIKDMINRSGIEIVKNP